MTTHRIVLLISDDEIAVLDEIISVLDQVAESEELNDDYVEDVDKINGLYGALDHLTDRIKTEVLAS